VAFRAAAFLTCYFAGETAELHSRLEFAVVTALTCYFARRNVNQHPPPPAHAGLPPAGEAQLYHPAAM
jgi:hypothetical protein